MFYTKFKKLRKCLSKAHKKKKKMKLLEEVVKQNPRYSSQKVIFNVCVTRWAENLDGYNYFLVTYPYIKEAVEEVFEKCLNWPD